MRNSRVRNRYRRAVGTAACLAALIVYGASAAHAGVASGGPAAGPSTGPTPASMFPGCAPAGGAVTVAVGQVACQDMPTRLLGGTTAFSYYVPPACAPALGRRCPVLYLLHGFGGDYTSMLGSAAHPSGWVAALDHAPKVSPYDTSQPWTEADPAAWVATKPLAMVLVAPDGRTTPGGYGPAPGLDGYWADWNPRYAAGGDQETYATAPPHFAGFVVDELTAFVQAHLPVARERSGRALAGTSLGGYGSYAIGLDHPDRWSSLGAVSGIMNILLLPGLDPTTRSSPVGLQPPIDLGRRPLPGHLVPLADVPGPAREYAVATYAFGDPTADQAYYRGHQPRDLAFNALARADTGPSLYIRGFSNDAVARQSSDLADPPGFLGAQAFETLVLASNQELDVAFDDVGATYTYELHPGIHEDSYWNPWLRSQEVAQYAHLRHWDGGGDPPPTPTVFSYRSIATSFSVWGWKVAVSRPNVEFMQLSNVSCAGLAIKGTGVVSVTVPASCHTGINGSRTLHVDLGNSSPLDAPAGADSAAAYGRTVTLHLTRIR